MLINNDVLTADFQPSEIVHRHDEVESLSNAIGPVTDGTDKPMYGPGAIIWGPTGTGKTTSAQFLLSELAESTDVHTAIVDCWEHNTTNEVYETILSEVHGEYSPHPSLQSRGALLKEIKETIDEPCIVVLDEADQLRDEDVLYTTYETNMLVPVIIVNRKLEFLPRLDDRIVSRIQGYTSVRFGTYTISELTGILEARVRAAIGPKAVDDDVLTAIAKQSDGDARRAIAVLREAVARGGPEFDTDDVEAVRDEADAAVRERSLGKLTQTQEILYQILLKADELATGELYQRYSDRVDDPQSKRSIRYNLNKLADYELIIKSGQKRGRTYEAVDSSQ